jgi:hypothetical protein
VWGEDAGQSVEPALARSQGLQLAHALAQTLEFDHQLGTLRTLTEHAFAVSAPAGP